MKKCPFCAKEIKFVRIELLKCFSYDKVSVICRK